MDRDGVAFYLMFPSILEGFGKRRGLKDQWKPHFIYRELLARVEAIAYAQGDEAGAEWAKRLRARGTRLKEEGAARRLQGRHDPYADIAWVMMVGHAILSLADCGPLPPTGRGEKASLVVALAKATGYEARAVEGAWGRCPLRIKQEQPGARRCNPKPKMPPIAPDVRCSKCRKSGMVPLTRVAAAGVRALCLNCREWRGN